MCPIELDVSYNRPIFDSCVEWQTNATNFWNISTWFSGPLPIFITTNNTIYSYSLEQGRLFIWPPGRFTPIEVFNDDYRQSYAIFVTHRGEVYMDGGFDINRVDYWSPNGTTMNGTFVNGIMNVQLGCRGLFIDITNTIYCSASSINQVLKKHLSDKRFALSVAAGSGCGNSESGSLHYPLGIFVDINFDLYVADYWNNRIQMFPMGQSSGITMVAAVGRYNISLNNPTSIVLDAMNNMYIADGGNHRVVKAGPHGTRCIIGCTGTSGSSSSELYGPGFIAFDVSGNLFISDTGNRRIQRFDVLRNNCGT
jgi:DNA-binding beta-propeller fold protein YncE